MFRLADSSDDDDDHGTSESALVPFPTSECPVGVPRTTTGTSSIILANGKPLKSSLKSSSSSSSPSLPLHTQLRTRSEPATLLAPNNVHFPEGDLASVRIFNRSARPASLSKPVDDDIESETETDNSPVVAKKVFQLNTQACSKVPRKHQQLDFYVNVHLEGIQLKSSTAASPAVTGYILVRNVAFEKSVAVRFTLDSWQTTSEVSARHQASLASLPDEFLRSSSPASFGPTISNLTPKSPEWDRFSFTIKLEDYAQDLDQRTMWLVVRYSVPGDDGHHEWWDNNGGANYKLGFRAASSSPHTLPKLPFPIAPAVSASTAVPLRHQNDPHTTTPRHELPAYPYHLSEEPPPEGGKLLHDQHAQHQAVVAQTTLSRLKKPNHVAPSPIVSPYSNPNSSRRLSVSTSSADNPQPQPSLLDQFHPKNRPHRLYYPDEPTEGLGTKRYRTGACSRCIALKVKCEFKTGGNPCKRCLNGGHNCLIPPRRKRRAPSKHVYLLNQLRAQAAEIQKLTSQLEARNTLQKPIVSQDDDDVSSDEVNMDADGDDFRVSQKRKIYEIESSPTQPSTETNGTSACEQYRMPSSSLPPPSESSDEILQSLLVALTKLRTVRGPLVNDNTFQLFCKLLAIPDDAIASGVETANSDVELLFDFFLGLFRQGSIQVENLSRDAKRKARKLMFKLMSKTNILPRPLFITNIEKDPHAIAVGGFGRVFKGKYGVQLVALKMLYHGRRTGDSIEKNLYTEAVAWRSLSHRFILPLLGIYEDGPQLFLVSPFMANGALREWRRDHVPVRIDEIRRLLLEVAEGVQYIHSEGIVHGDLHGGNVLVNSEFHCQITDFGSTRHCDVPATRSTTTLSLNFAPPELFGMCATCGELDCEESHHEQHKIKTKKTDVYAFGCLYYSIFFDTIPFHEKSDFQIIRLVTKGVRPDRLKNPIMEEHTWNLVQRCWTSKPFERPTMESVVTELTPPGLPSDFTTCHYNIVDQNVPGVYDVYH